MLNTSVRYTNLCLVSDHRQIIRKQQRQELLADFSVAEIHPTKDIQHEIVCMNMKEHEIKLFAMICKLVIFFNVTVLHL